LVPFSVFPTTASDLPQLPPRTWLSCALGVSHPLDALLPLRPAGLIPSRIRSWAFPTRLSHPRSAVSSLERRLPLDVGLSQATRLIFRASHTPELPTVGPRFNRMTTTAAPLGILPHRVFAVSVPIPTGMGAPSRASPSTSKVDANAGAPGYLPGTTKVFSREIT
jgi:hypothetical protein